MKKEVGKSVVAVAFLFIITILPQTILAQRKQAVDLLIVGGTIVTMDSERRIIENGGIAVKNGQIVAVSSSSNITRTYLGKTVINASGKVIIPGLINTHSNGFVSRHSR